MEGGREVTLNADSARALLPPHLFQFLVSPCLSLPLPLSLVPYFFPFFLLTKYMGLVLTSKMTKVP